MRCPARATWSLPAPGTSPTWMTRPVSIAHCAISSRRDLADPHRRLDVPADCRGGGTQMVQHARRVIERAGDEEHEKYHQLGHGDLDRMGLSEGALLPRGLPAWSSSIGERS